MIWPAGSADPDLVGLLDSDALMGVGALLAAGLIAALIGGVWVTIRKLRRPPRRTYAWALARGVAGEPCEMQPAREFEEIGLDVGGGVRAAAWEIQGKRAGGATVILTPGWGSSKLGALVRLPGLEQWAGRIVAWDPAGHGDSPGTCALGTREPEQIVRIAERYSDRGAVILMGWSLGGGASIAAGALCGSRGIEIAGVIAEAPYRKAWTPALRVMRASGLPWRINGRIAMGVLGTAFGVGPRWRAFDRAVWAGRLGCPLLVVHGSEDPVSPVGDGREIAAAAGQGEILEIEGGGHNNLWSESFIDEVGGRCGAFAERCVQGGDKVGAIAGDGG